MKRFSGAFLLVLLVCTLVTSVQAATKNLKVSITMADGDPTADAARQVLKPFIEKASNGRYKVDIYPGGSIGQANTVFQGIQFGTLHFATESTSNLSPFAPELSVFDLPYLFPDAESIKYFFSTKAGADFLGHFKKTGVLPVKVMPAPFRIIASNRPLATLDDVSGLKLRTTTSKWHMEGIKALGMNPTPLPSSEMITSLQQNVVGGCDTNVTGLLSWRFVDVAKHVLITNHAPVVHLLYTNAKWFEGLPAEDRELFTRAIEAYYEAVQTLYAERIVKDIEVCEKQYGVKVVTLSPEERQKWVNKSLPLYDTLPDELKAVTQIIRANLGPSK